MKKMKKMKKDIVLYIASATISALLIVSVLIALNVYPFGNFSILRQDLNIQYFDFFKYLQRCLTGKDSLIYSFNKSLGGTMIAVYAYYLSSPLNLLLYFFEDIQLFITVITILKIALSSFTMSVYLRNRFENLQLEYILILSIGFSMGNYNLLQISNIMWLDGVYMLPLLLLAVYRFIHNDERIKFSVCVGVMILFCWYISYMNCIFAVIYFLYESLLANYAGGLKNRVKKLCMFCFYEGVGVLLSGVLLFPVVVEMLKGKGVQHAEIFTFSKSFSIQELLKGFMYSQDSVISLFCGTLVLISVVAFFLTKKIQWKQKILSGILLIVMILSMQIKAFENIWNGFRYASYFCRFSMLSIFVLILFAADFLDKISEKKIIRYLCYHQVLFFW